MARILGIPLVIIIAAVAIIGSQSIYTVDETNHAIVLQFQEIQQVNSDPGLYFKLPFIQQISYLDKRILTSDTRPQEYLTSDEKRIVVDQVTRWRITNPAQFFVALRTESVARDRLDTLVLAELRAQVAASPYDTMISADRDLIMETVKQGVQLRVTESGLGVDITDVRTKRADLPIEVQANVFARMESARIVEAERHRKQGEQKANEITAETDRLVTIMQACANRVAEETRGAGDAAAIAIFAQALSQDPEFFTFVRRLEAYAKAFGPNDRLVMSTGSDFFKLLTGEGVIRPENVSSTASLEVEPIQPLSGDVTKSISDAEVETLILQCIPEVVQEID